MTTVYNLPVDILRLIFLGDAKPPSVEINSISDWKAKLSILSVCQLWRNTAKNIVYGHAILTIEQGFTACSCISKTGQGYDMPADISTVGHTNIGLIVKNGYTRMVNRMYITFMEADCIFYPLLSILIIFSADRDECELLERRRNLLELDDFYWKVKPDRRALVRDITVALRRRLPNIQTLELSTHDYLDRFQLRFVNELLAAYSNQLTQVWCDSLDKFPNLQLATQLQLANFYLRYDHLTDVSLACPDTLRDLQIYCDDFEFTMEYLRADKESNVVRFSCLETLHVLSNVHRYGISNNDIPFRFELPRLTDLTLSFVRVVPGFAKSLAHAPLQRLSFSGNLSDAHLLCSQLHCGLKDIFVYFNLFSDTDPSEEFPLLVNGLFSQMRGAKSVECTLHANNRYLDLYPLDLFYLTHLKLEATVDFNALIDKIPTMENMISLDINVAKLDSDQAARTKAKLADLCGRYSTPLRSKLKRLSLDLYSPQMNESDLVDIPFGKFHRWLPQLEELWTPEYLWQWMEL